MKKQKKFIGILTVLVIVLISANGFIFTNNKSLHRDFDNAASKLNADLLDPKLNLATYSIAAGSTYVAPTLKIKTYPLGNTGKTIDIPESWDYTESAYGFSIGSPSMDFINDTAFIPESNFSKSSPTTFKIGSARHPGVTTKPNSGYNTSLFKSVKIDGTDKFLNYIEANNPNSFFLMVVSKNNYMINSTAEYGNEDLFISLLHMASTSSTNQPINEDTLQRYSEYQNLINIIKSIK